MSKRDYYEILGVQRTVTDVELKAAYRKLAMHHHPARNQGAADCEHKFKELSAALSPGLRSGWCCMASLR